MDNNSYAQLIDDFEKGLLVIEGESLTDYITRMGGVDYDAKANGGIMGYAIGGRTRNLSDVYDNSSVLQDKYSTQQDYLDLFDQSTTTTPTTSTTTITDLIEQAPETMLPPRVRPLLIPQTEGSDGGGGITRARTDMNQPNAMGGKVPGETAARQRGEGVGGFFDKFNEIRDNPYIKYNPFNPMFMFNVGKTGLTKARDFATKLAEERQAAKELAQQLAAVAETNRILGNQDYGQGGVQDGNYDTSNMDSNNNYSDPMSDDTE